MRASLREAVGSAINTDDISGKDAELLNGLAVGATEIGALLWRIKYGDDHRPVTLRAAKAALVRRIHANPRRVPGPLVVDMAELALSEWLADRCTVCHGRRYIGTEYGDQRATRERCPAGCQRTKSTGTFASPGSKLFETTSERFLARLSCQSCAGKGWVPGLTVDASKTRSCPACDGKGRVRMGNGARARVLNIPRQVFEARHLPRYEKALAFLRACDKRTGVTVANAMEWLEGAPGLDTGGREGIIAP